MTVCKTPNIFNRTTIVLPAEYRAYRGAKQRGIHMACHPVRFFHLPHKWYLLLLFLVGGGANHFIHAQLAHKYRLEADKYFKLGQINQAEEKYRKSLERESSARAEYNLGNTLYLQKRWDEAVEHYQKAIEQAQNPDMKADAYYNLGNAFFQKQKYDKSIQAYKDALKLRPDDLAYKHNLYLAQLKQQQQKQQQQQNEEQNKQQDQDKEQQQQEQQQNEEQNKQQDQDKEQQQQNEEQNKQQDQDKEQQQQEQQEQQQNKREQEDGKENEEGGGEEQDQPERKNLSKEDALRLLKIIEQEDKKVNQKLRKATGQPNKSKKDW